MPRAELLSAVSEVETVLVAERSLLQMAVQVLFLMRICIFLLFSFF